MRLLRRLLGPVFDEIFADVPRHDACLRMPVPEEARDQLSQLLWDLLEKLQPFLTTPVCLADRNG